MSRSPGVAVFLVALAAASPPSIAQAQTFGEADSRPLDDRLSYFFVQDPGEEASLRAAGADALADPLNNTFALVYYALPPGEANAPFRAFLQLAQRARVDQQIGASARGGASGVASRTGLASVLGLALESGAVTQTVGQNLMTLRANADGLYRFLSNPAIFSPCGAGPGCGASQFLATLELSASFSVSDADTETVSGTVPGSDNQIAFTSAAGTRQLRTATARYAVLNSRDLRSPEYRERWARWLQQNATALRAEGSLLLAQAEALSEAVDTTNEKGLPTSEAGGPSQYQVWRQQTLKQLEGATLDEEGFRQLYARRLDDLVARMRKLDPEFDVKLERLADAYARYLSTRRSLAVSLVTDPALTVEYNFTNPPLQPKLHTVRVAYAYSPQGTSGPNPGTITLNAGLGFFDRPQPTGTLGEAERWRDLHLAVQFDRPLGPPDSAAQLSMGLYYQYLPNPSIIEMPSGSTVLPGTTIPLTPGGAILLGESGSLFVGQAVLTIRIPGSGLRMPIGFSWSNRTEFATGNEVRGHVGFTFDPATLFLLAGS
jgi:hypothetical protein